MNTETVQKSIVSTPPTLKRVVGRPIQKGQVLNPGGRPKDEIGAYIRKQKGLPEKIVKYLEEILKDEKATDQNRIRAAEVLMDRGWGKPTQQIESESLNDVVRTILVRSS